jgi:hypothetical protein
VASADAPDSSSATLGRRRPADLIDAAEEQSIASTLGALGGSGHARSPAFPDSNSISPGWIQRLRVDEDVPPAKRVRAFGKQDGFERLEAVSRRYIQGELTMAQFVEAMKDLASKA